jgi:hypothetical protein
MVVARWVLLAILTGSSVLRAQQTPESFQAFSTCVLPPLSPQADPWPVATTDVLGTMNSASVTFSGATLLANDRGTSLAVVSVGPSSSAGGAITGADPFTFTVSPGFQGEDIFSYEIRDGSGQTAVGLVKVSAVGDAVLPTVSLTAPVGGATVAGSVVVSASATDNIGIASVRFFDGSTQIGPQVTGAPFQVTWNTTGVPNGTHNLTAVARDPAGNTSTSAIVAVTVSNAAPVDPGGAGPVLALNFDSVTGDIVSDASGFNNHGTVRGATSQAGKIGKALKFDGVDDWVTVADAASLDLTSAMTLEAWVNPSTLTQWHTVLLKESAAGMAYELYAHNPDISRPAAYGTLNGALRGVTGTAALPTNTWTHLATTYDGTNMQLYVNGALVRSVARAGVMDATTGPLRIGGNVPWGGEFFAGLIDEVRVYNRALTASEIAADMNRGGTPPPPPPPAPTPAGPVLALGFNEAAGSPIAHDSSGSGRDGSIREAQIVPGKFGNALSFDGVNDWVTVADAAALDLTSAMTLEAWVRPSEIAGWRTVLMKESPDSAAYELYANEETDRPSAYFVAGTTFKGVTGTAALATAAWTHLATTYDGANMRLYVNGVLARTVARTGAINTTAAPLRVGGNNAWGEFFSGLIDEVRVYNRALSQSEIQADMNTPLQ